MRVISICMIMFFALSSQPAAQENEESNPCEKFGKIIVPNILGLSENEAKKTIEECGLKWVYSMHPGAMSYEAIGVIGDQSPKGGELTDRGNSIRGFRSNGFYLPNLIGWHEADAVAFLRDLRLAFEVKTQRDSYPAGTVIDQSPRNAERFSSKDSIELFVSEGPWVEIPKLVGREYNPSVKELERLKLIAVHGGGSLESGYKKITVCEAEAWYPVVARLEPEEGNKVFEGDEILVFSKTAYKFYFYKPPGEICP